MNLSQWKKKLLLGALALVVLVGLFLLEGALESLFLKRVEGKAYWDRFALQQSDLLRRCENAKPLLKKDVSEFHPYSRSALVVELKNGDSKTLLSHAPAQPYPIASLTKLMNVLVSLDNYSLGRKVVFSSEAASKEGGPNFFKEGERFTVRQLIQSSLIESSNRAAAALAEVLGEDEFIKLMNNKAYELGMNDTRFFNATGLDPDYEDKYANYSSAQDLVRLIKETGKKTIIRDASSMPAKGIYTHDGEFHHDAESTNKLLGSLNGVYVAKTGTTPIAKSCLVLMIDNPKDDHVLIAVVLGADDNFMEMSRMLNWVYDSYNF